MAIRQRSNPHSTEAQFVHRMEIPVVWGEIFLLVALLSVGLGDGRKVRALVAALVAVSGRGGSGLVSPGWG